MKHSESFPMARMGLRMGMHAGRGPACREDKRGVAADKGILGVCVCARA